MKFSLSSNSALETMAEEQSHRPPSVLARVGSVVSWAKRGVVLVGLPLAGLPLLFPPLGSPEWRCAYVVLLMSAFWIAEVMPLAATALMPMFLFPLLGLLPSSKVAPAYLPDTNFLFIGGLMVAVAVEKCGLHQRIALRVLTLVGAQPKWIMLGFMSVTAVLSMWISNTATTAMMVPIAQSVAQQLLGRARKDVPPTTTDAASPGPSPQGSAEAMLRRKAERKDSLQTPPLGHMERRDSRLAGRIMAPSEEADEPKLQLSQLSPSEANIAKALLVCIAFAANIGGTATITGTPPNLVTVGILEKAFPGADTGVNFASWLQFAVPLMLVTLSMCWLILVLVFLGPSALLCRAKASDGAQSAEVESRMRRRYESLPKISFAEVSVLCCFLILLFLWILRDPGQFPGFGTLFKSEPRTGKPFVTDATSAVLVGVLLFALPERWPRRGSEAGALMDWRAMQENFPWSVVLLLGGGFALAAGVKESGLSGRIGGALEGLGGLSLGGMQLVCALLTMAVSNVCSNTVTASIFVPIVAGLAVQLGVHPLHLTLPVGLSCSLAFCLPVATPPNAIAFASGLLSVGDLAKAGLPVSLASALLVLANQHSIGTAMFGSDFPQWANATATP